MLTYIWLFMVATGIFFGLYQGQGQVVLETAVLAAQTAIKTGLELAGILAFWLGIMDIAEKSGLVRSLAKIARPLMIKLFPSLPPEDPVMGSIMLNLTANFLGMGNAATPFGLEAMAQMSRLSQDKTVATEAMCTFLVLNAAGLTLIPSTVLSLRISQGSSNPTAFIPSMLLTGLTGIMVGLMADRFFAFASKKKKGRCLKSKGK